MFAFLERGFGRTPEEVPETADPTHEARSNALYNASRALMQRESSIANKAARSVLVRTTTTPVFFDGQFHSLAIYGRIFGSYDYPSEIYLRLDNKPEHVRVTHKGTRIFDFLNPITGQVEEEAKATPSQMNRFADYVSSAGQTHSLGKQVENVLSSTPQLPSELPSTPAIANS